VTWVPVLDGFGAEDSVVAVVILLTVWVSAAEVLPVKF
jgi:hypothetical protein